MDDGWGRLEGEGGCWQGAWHARQPHQRPNQSSVIKRFVTAPQRTLLTCTPRPRCTPAQRMQMKTPQLMEAQVGRELH